MARMVRKQIYVEKRQDEALKRRAERLGVSEAELIRQGIDQVCREPEDEERQRRVDAWKRIEDYIHTHRMLDVPQVSDPGWTRDELYEDRINRYPG